MSFWNATAFASVAATMTPLLSFLDVSKRYPDGGREILVLDRVSLEIDEGMSVGIYGSRRSGKSTLLRLAAGLALPDSGTISFRGRDIARMSSSERSRLLRSEVAFMSSADWNVKPGETVVDHVATSLGSEGLTIREARRRAMQVLDQVEIGAAGAGELTSSLSLTERVRTMLARALAREPRLLVLDEPALFPSLGDRDKFHALLRSLAREHDVALLVGSEEMRALQGFGVLASISEGELVSTGSRATVVPLPGRRRAATERYVQ
jgi:ABC-type lipoprotein export system ATPase subunit